MMMKAQNASGKRVFGNRIEAGDQRAQQVAATVHQHRHRNHAEGEHHGGEHATGSIM